MTHSKSYKLLCLSDGDTAILRHPEERDTWFIDLILPLSRQNEFIHSLAALYTDKNYNFFQSYLPKQYSLKFHGNELLPDKNKSIQ